MSEPASKILLEDPSSARAKRAPQAGGDELALVRLCQAGQTEAFAKLVRNYQDRIYNLLYRMCGRHEDAEDLAQEVFVKAFRNIGRFRGQSRLYTWLFRIAKNTAISHIRRRRRVKFVPLTGDDDETQAADARTAGVSARRNPPPEARAIAGETAERIARALDTLEEDFRIVVLLRDIEDMNYDEIADVLEIPAGTVKSRLHRARCRLRDQLADLVQERT